ncbi:hypothetical protein BKA70DRAFT_1424791 [Coprinopsis sp. MPI-PUGE-AT-0042]|nr:hypothetical protein BKA70DRAFT_1424791 [Coprinopsis sp. MPI-PUGE-AT-0042]
MGATSALQPHGEDTSTVKLPSAQMDAVGAPQSPQCNNNNTTTNLPLASASASATQPPPAEMGAVGAPQPPNGGTSTSKPPPAQAIGGLPQPPPHSVAANALQPLNALVAAAAAASLTPVTSAGTATARSSGDLSISSISNPTKPTSNTVCFAGGLDALVAAAAASIPLSPPGTSTSSTPTAIAASVIQKAEVTAADTTSSPPHVATGPPQAPAPSTVIPTPQALPSKRLTRGSLRTASAGKGSSSTGQSKKLPSQTARDPPEGSKRKRLNYYWKCPLTGKEIENDELPDNAHPTKKPKHVSSAYKENTLQGSESTKRRGRMTKKQ